MPNKTVGHRSYARYYKQKFRKQDDPISVQALKREEVYKLGKLYKCGATKLDENALMKLSDAAVAGVLAQQRKEVLKATKMEQRAARKHQYHTQRVFEYKSTVDKLRSSINTTDKIRDYHGRLQ